MISYSVTVTVDREVEQEWLAWMRMKHIPDVMATGCFLKARLCRLLDPSPEEGSATFNVQYDAEGLAAYKRYLDQHAPALQAEHSERYAGKFAAFRTLLRVEDSY